MSVSRVEYDAALTKVRELQAAIRSARAICVEAADMGCECHGNYYRCNNCPDRIANRAQDAVEVFERLDSTLAALGLDEPPTETTHAERWPDGTVHDYRCQGECVRCWGADACGMVGQSCIPCTGSCVEKTGAVLPPAEPPKAWDGLSPFMPRAADRLYDECERAIREGRIDARSPIGDATLDYRDMRAEKPVVPEPPKACPTCGGTKRIKTPIPGVPPTQETP